MATKERKLLTTINNFPLYDDTIYVITGKRDTKAPKPLQDLERSDMPFPGNSREIACHFDYKVSKVWDTGFFEGSPCYRGMDPAIVAKLVKERKENIQKPYERVRGEGLTSQTNNDFWDSFKVKLQVKEPFTTLDPIKRFELYIGLLSCGITPEDQKGLRSPEYEHSIFCVEDGEIGISASDKRGIQKSAAIENFTTMYKGTPDERNKAIDIFCYLGGIPNAQYNKDMMAYNFAQWLEMEPKNVNDFIRVCDMAEIDEHRETFRCNRILTFLLAHGKMGVRDGAVTYSGTRLGADMKSAANALANSKELENMKLTIFEDYEKLYGKL